MWSRAIFHTLLSIIPKSHKNLTIPLKRILSHLPPTREHIINRIISQRWESIDNKRSRSSNTTETRETTVNIGNFLAFPDRRTFTIRHIQDERSRISTVMFVEIFGIVE